MLSSGATQGLRTVFRKECYELAAFLPRPHSRNTNKPFSTTVFFHFASPPSIQYVMTASFSNVVQGTIMTLEKLLRYPGCLCLARWPGSLKAVGPQCIPRLRQANIRFWMLSGA